MRVADARRGRGAAVKKGSAMPRCRGLCTRMAACMSTFHGWRWGWCMRATIFACSASICVRKSTAATPPSSCGSCMNARGSSPAPRDEACNKADHFLQLNGRRADELRMVINHACQNLLGNVEAAEVRECENANPPTAAWPRAWTAGECRACLPLLGPIPLVNSRMHPARGKINNQV